MSAAHNHPVSAEVSPPLVCRWCGQEHRRPPLAAGQRALCVRCGSVLAKRSWWGRDAALAYAAAALLLAVPAFTLPLLHVDKLQNARTAYGATSAEALWRHGMPLLGTWTMLCSVVIPALLLGTLAGLLLPPRFGRRVPGEKILLRFAHALEQWAMPEVHLLAVLVALTRLGTLVDVHVGPGLWFYGAMSALLLLAWRSFEFGAGTRDAAPATLAVEASPPASSFSSARPRSATAAALGVAAAIMLVPANVLPVVSTNTGGSARTDTIYSGILELLHEGLWGIGAIVFVASIVIPVLKLVGLAWLLLARRQATGRRREATKLYVGLGFVGRWSMLDVFLVGFLAGVVQFGALAKVEPRAGIVAFAAAVVLTVLATDAFDPRSLWDQPASAA